MTRFSLWSTCLVAASALAAPAAEPAKVQAKARQILESRCVECHGGRATRAGLDLTTRAGLLKGGHSGPAVVPGDPKQSRLYQQVTHQAKPGMPFKRDNLSAQQIAALAAWIADGAKYDRALKKEIAQAEEDWWSLKPLEKPQPPAVAGDWARNPIDRFILAKLREKGLSPSPEADRRTLLRRVKFDLVGLPPTPEETAAFLADNSPDAYERFVDRLLASPQYGERWARHWMDVVHFAETHGQDQDRPRPNAWPYRDYLIRSLNADKPYARFVQEQVAGDVLFPDQADAVRALGFLAAGPWDESSLRDIREDSIDREIGRYLDRDDIITTVGSAILSTSVHCARCHDHKFDPVTQEEYYRLQAVFAATDKADRTFEPDPATAKARRALLARKAALPQLAEKADPSLLDAGLQTEVAAWEKTVAAAGSHWLVLQPESFTTANGSVLTKQPDSSLLAGGTKPEKDTYTIVASSSLPRVTGVRLEVLTHDSLPQKGPGRQDNGNLHLNEFAVTVAPKGATGDAAKGKPVALKNPRADFNQEGWEVAKAIDGNTATAWGIHPQVGKPHTAVFEFAEPVALSAGATFTFRLQQTHGSGHLIGRPRLSLTGMTTPLPIQADTLPQAVAAVLAVPAKERTPRQRAELAAFVQGQKINRELAALPPLEKVYAGTNKFEPEGSFKPAGKPRPVHLLKRGNILNPGPLAPPGTLGCVEGLESRFALANADDEGSRRAALARWLSDPKNVLTWRSVANRVWHHHFGRGIVDTPNDLGRMGALPAHPELLDWLAVTLLENGGSLKTLHRLIVTSAAYRQSSAHDPKFAEIDGDNRYLWRMNRLRLDAEAVRDALLAVSGKLDPKMGGPSVKQFNMSPGIHVTPNVDYIGFDVDRPENYRRSVYRFIFRTLPDPFMEALDCPDASQWIAARNNSVTPLQALAMLNNRFVVRQCEHIAERAAKQEPGLEGQVSAAFGLILGRQPTAAERESFTRYAARHGLANVCRLLVNSNEFMFVN